MFKKSIALFKTFNFYFLKNKALFIIIGMNGFFILKMPNIFFFKLNNENFFSFLFINYYHYKSFISFFNVLYNRLYNYFFFRLKLIGRGYRIKKLSNNLYRFYFIRVNYIYLHVPSSVLIKYKKPFVLLISNNFEVLQKLYQILLLINPITVYRRKGLVFPREIIYMKAGKKRL